MMTFVVRRRVSREEGKVCAHNDRAQFATEPRFFNPILEVQFCVLHRCESAIGVFFSNCGISSVVIYELE